MNKFCAFWQQFHRQLSKLDFIPLLSVRLYLAPIFIIAGWNKYVNFDDMVAWFGNSEWGLGLPMPSLMVSLVIIAELIGGVALLLGAFTRSFSFMLSITMLVAIFKVHLKNGWHAITPTNPDTSIAALFSFLPSGQASLDNSLAAGERLMKAKEILQTYGNYDWLTETGNFTILNNGIEFGTTYLIMLLVLIFFGAGRFMSVDYLLQYTANKHK
ncbi:HvfX family Cu-binding RiPP maturation protein [Moraxella marmotae]|uniref:HvfX family Cu-binding RiPP maturation protein n=1 Tax=Moraxella marmotae TaxID=3344520 RepID=UPI0035D45F77